MKREQPYFIVYLQPHQSTNGKQWAIGDVREMQPHEQNPAFDHKVKRFDTETQAREYAKTLYVHPLFGVEDWGTIASKRYKLYSKDFDKEGKRLVYANGIDKKTLTALYKCFDGYVEEADGELYFDKKVVSVCKTVPAVKQYKPKKQKQRWELPKTTYDKTKRIYHPIFGLNDWKEKGIKYKLYAQGENKAGQKLVLANGISKSTLRAIYDSFDGYVDVADGTLYFDKLVHTSYADLPEVKVFMKTTPAKNAKSVYEKPTSNG